MEFYGRGVKLVKDPRAREIFRKLATEEVHHLKTLENRYQELLKQDPQLESRPTFLFFKGAANGLFSTGAEQLRRDGVDDLEAYRIGIRCERGSHRFFKRYGERFEDSEGKRIFLEFAEEEREHLELLIREYRALVKRHRGRRRDQATARSRRSSKRSKSRARHSHKALIDLHMHTTASDGRLTPAELVDRAAAAGLTTISVTDHDTVAALRRGDGGRARRRAFASCRASRSRRSIDGRDVHMLGYFFDPASAPLSALLVSQRALRVSRVQRDRRAGSRRSTCRWTSTAVLLVGRGAARIVGRPSAARARAGARRATSTSVQEAFDEWLATGRPAYVPRTGPEPRRGDRHDSRGRRRRVVRASRRDQARRADRPLVDQRARCHRGLSLRSHARGRDRISAAWRRASACSITGGSDFHGEDLRRDSEPSAPDAASRRPSASVTLPPPIFAALEEPRLRQGVGATGS